ncbi:hypothetical protein Tco_1068836 [Tanacetum coccineum]|uniref:Retroviral polymerase SH3-like domain-containing protein n=1 Tax=Tanacetum coccineum TaxID=301880 RepID=A0ABQ5HIA0_9ASTR
MLRSCWKLLKRDLLVSQLELLDEKLSQEDVNQKLLRSLSPEWNTHAVVWRNKADLDTMSMDDLYNNLKSPKWSATTANKVGILLGSAELKYSDNKNKESQGRSVHVETYTSTTLVSCDGLGGYGWSDQAEKRPNYALMAFSSSIPDSKVIRTRFLDGGEITIRELRKKLEIVLKEKDGIQLNVDKFEHASKSLNKLIECQIVDNCRRKYDNALSIEEWVSDDEEEDVSQPKTKKKTVRPSIVKKEFVKSKQQEKTARKTVKQVEQHRQNTHSPRGNQRNWNNMMSQKLDDQETCPILSGLMEEIDGGYVAFGGNPKGGKITRKCTIKTDHLGKFNSKADESFFVGYSLNSKAFRVSNSRTRIVEENLHIRFTESIPNDVGSGPDWLFDIDALTRTMNYEPIIAGTQSNGFAYTKASDNADPKSSHDDGSKPSSDDGKKVDECNDQEKGDNVNNVNNVNAAGTNKVNAVGGKTSIELPFDLNMPALEDYNIFDFSRDNEDDGSVADMNNLDTTIEVSPILTTRIHKDHHLDQVIRDLQSSYTNKKMSKEFGGHELCLRYKVEKALYGLHQAPKAWYKGDILLVQVYVDDIIFGSTKMELCIAFEKLMHEEFLDAFYWRTSSSCITSEAEKYVDDTLKKIWVYKSQDYKHTNGNSKASAQR